MSFTETRHQKRIEALLGTCALWKRDHERGGEAVHYWLCFDNCADRNRGVTQLRQLFPQSTYEHTSRQIEERPYFVLKLPDEQAEALMGAAQAMKRFVDTSFECYGERKIGVEARKEAAKSLHDMLKAPSVAGQRLAP